MIKTIAWLAMLCSVLLVSGCQTLRSGGAPPPSYDPAGEMEALSKRFAPALVISNFYDAAPEKRVQARDNYISGRLAMIDLAYRQYVQAITADKQRLEAGSAFTGMILNLAGTLTGGVQAKANLAAAAAGVSGTQTIVDKNFYYDKSIDALVHAMNARRKEVLVLILTGMAQKNIDAYSFDAARGHLDDYYDAGTIGGALNFVTVQASQQQKASDEKIKNIPTVTLTTQTQVDATSRLTLSINSKLNSKLNADRARMALVGLGADSATLPTDLKALQALLSNLIHEIPNMEPEKKTETLQKMTKAFQNAGILIDADAVP